jgi:hypothetical protein
VQSISIIFSCIFVGILYPEPFQSETQRYCMFVDVCFYILLFISASYTSYSSLSLCQSALLGVFGCWFRSSILVVTILLVSLSLMLVALCVHQVNQRTSSIELAERANKHFLLQLVSSLVWETRHWANKMGLLSTLAPTIGAKPNSSSSDSSTLPVSQQSLFLRLCQRHHMQSHFEPINSNVFSM